MLDIAEKYSEVKFNYIILTKLDETLSTGAVIDTIAQIKKPITYVTYGQNVPDDLAVASKELLVENALI